MKKKDLLYCVICLFLGCSTVSALDFDAVDNNAGRKNYTHTPIQQVKPEEQVKSVEQVNQPVKDNTPITNAVQQTITKPEPQVQDLQNYEKLPAVPKLPSKAFSKTVAPINTMYTGKKIDENAIIPCKDIKINELTLDERYTKTKFVNIVVPKKSTVSKTPTPTKTIQASNYRYRRLAKGVQFRVVNVTKINDYMGEGQKIVFKTTQEVKTPYLTVPANTRIIGVIEDVHRPQMTCNGGLVSIRLSAIELNGISHNINGSIIKIKTDRVRLGNLKGDHTYLKTTCKKAKWGQTKFKQWSKTSSMLADKGAGIIIAPFPYIGGCITALGSTVTSPITALLGKGGSLSIAPNTTFTIKLNEEAKIRY